MNVVATFRGERAATAPLTWGQQGIWKLIAAMAPNDAFLNLCKIIPVPQKAQSVESVTAAFGDLISRHEALRTLVGTADGEPCQLVTDAGECPLEVIESTAESAEADAEQAMERLRRRPFDYADELPIRMALVVADGRVRFAVLVLSHVAVDWYAFARLERDLRVLFLRGSITAPPGKQPVDLAREESGEAGRERTARAHDHWKVQYGRFPARVFTEKIAEPARPRYQWAEMTSRALDRACRVVAARQTVSTSTVLLAAAGALIGAHTGHDVCGMLTIVNNRFRDGLDDVVAPTNQLGVVTLDLRGATTFGGLVAAVWPEVLQCMRHAYYDQHTLDRFLADGGHVHGEKIAPFCCFNDMHTTTGGDPHAAEASEEQLLESRKATRVSWTEKLDEFNWQFMLSVSDAPGALNLALTTDSCYMPPERQPRFLLDLEDLVVRAAIGEVRLDGLAGRVS